MQVSFLQKHARTWTIDLGNSPPPHTTPPSLNRCGHVMCFLFAVSPPILLPVYPVKKPCDYRCVSGIADFFVPNISAAKEVIDVSADTKALASENVKKTDECVCCLDAKPTMLFVPCGHLATCRACALLTTSVEGSGSTTEILRLKKCPMCRTHVDVVINNE